MKPYKKPHFPELISYDWKERKNIYNDDNLIDWQKVAKNFGGIEFNPYTRQIIKSIKNGKKQIRITWYNTIDVPSGCIWNLKPIVDNVEKMKRSELSANFKNLS